MCCFPSTYLYSLILRTQVICRHNDCDFSGHSNVRCKSIYQLFIYVVCKDISFKFKIQNKYPTVNSWIHVYMLWQMHIAKNWVGLLKTPLLLELDDQRNIINIK